MCWVPRPAELLRRAAAGFPRPCQLLAVCWVPSLPCLACCLLRPAFNLLQPAFNLLVVLPCATLLARARAQGLAKLPLPFLPLLLLEPRRPGQRREVALLPARLPQSRQTSCLCWLLLLLKKPDSWTCSRLFNYGKQLADQFVISNQKAEPDPFLLIIQPQEHVCTLAC